MAQGETIFRRDRYLCSLIPRPYEKRSKPHS